MGRFHVYLKPFKEDGTYEDDWTEITDDVDAGAMGQLKYTLENSEYDVGVFKVNGFNLSLMNLDGRYSDVGNANTIFKYRRSNSLVKVTWEIMETDTRCGFVACGSFSCSPEVEVFTGILNDDSLKQNAHEQNLTFKVLGLEALFSQVEAPFSDLSAGDTFSEILYACLNQAAITAVMTVDVSNIVPGNDKISDSVAAYENATVAQVISDILLASRSTLYIRDGVLYVTARDPAVGVDFTFYGPGSSDGAENVIELNNFKIGLNRVFNYWTWSGTDLLSQASDAVEMYGIRKKEVNCDCITDTAKRQDILEDLRVEFAFPKRELDLVVPMTYDILELGLLDRVSIDYPNIAYVPEGVEVPLFDQAKFDVARFPDEILPIEIESALEFKIIGRSIDPANQTLTFELREV